jgi:hypothetical protein
MNQLSLFESRLSKQGQGPKSNNFHEEHIDIEPDELLLRNTYLNGLPVKPENKVNRSMSFNSKKLQWADNNNYFKKDLLCSTNPNKDLISQKEPKPVISHKRLKPPKPSLKKSNTLEYYNRKLTPTRFDNLTNNYINKHKENKDNSFTGNQMSNNYINAPRTPDEDGNAKLMSPLNMNRFDRDKSNNKEEKRITTPLRSYSLDQRGNNKENNINTNINDVRSSAEVTNIIIAPNMKSLISNNIKNYYINNNNNNNSQEDEIDKIANRYVNNRENSIDKQNNFKSNYSEKSFVPTRPSGLTRDTYSPLLNNSNSYNSRINVNSSNPSNNNYINNYSSQEKVTPTSKLVKSPENQRALLQNNYIMNTNSYIEYNLA